MNKKESDIKRCWQCAHWSSRKMTGKEALWVGHCMKETFFLYFERGGNITEALRYSERLHGTPACEWFQEDEKYSSKSATA